MRKISRIGATALALALSVSFLIPTQVYAANEKDNDRTQLIGLGNQKSDYRGYIRKKDGCVTGSYC